MGIEDLECRFGVIEFILGLDGVEQCLELNQGAVLILDEDDLGDLAEVAEDVVHAIVVVDLGDGPHKQYFGGTVLEQELF